MKIAIVNESTAPSITRPVLDRICAALNRQQQEHYAKLWQAAPIPISVADSRAEVPADNETVVLALFDDTPSPGILGYHDVTPEGLPYLDVFTNTIFRYGGTLMDGSSALSVTMSHEVLEAAVDPYCNLWAEDAQGIEHAFELGDATEGDSYDVDGVAMSNFIGPRWFDPKGGSRGPFDFMGLCSKPFERRPHSYEILRTASTDVHTATSRIMTARMIDETRKTFVEPRARHVMLAHFPADYPEWKIEQKRRPHSRASRRGMVFAS